MAVNSDFPSGENNFLGALFAPKVGREYMIFPKIYLAEFSPDLIFQKYLHEENVYKINTG